MSRNHSQVAVIRQLAVLAFGASELNLDLAELAGDVFAVSQPLRRYAARQRNAPTRRET
jgi:hypothetical protein